MHSEILSQAQIDQLPILAAFKKDFGLVGGTAIAYSEKVIFLKGKKVDDDIIKKTLIKISLE